MPLDKGLYQQSDKEAQHIFSMDKTEMQLTKTDLCSKVHFSVIVSLLTLNTKIRLYVSFCRYTGVFYSFKTESEISVHTFAVGLNDDIHRAFFDISSV